MGNVIKSYNHSNGDKTMSKYNLIAEACTKLTFPLKIAYTLKGIPTTEDERAAVETFSQMTLQAVRDEDYALVATVQGALRSGANDSFLIGRNEPAVQHYHRAIADLAAN